MKRHNDRGYINTEAEIGIMWSQVKKCQDPPRDGKSKEMFSPGVFRGHVDLLTP